MFPVSAGEGSRRPEKEKAERFFSTRRVVGAMEFILDDVGMVVDCGPVAKAHIAFYNDFALCCLWF